MTSPHRHDGRTRVVITGVGAITPSGADADTTFQTVLTGHSAAQPITTFDTTDHPVHFASAITDFDPETVVEAREARRVDRASLLGLAAANEALRDAGLDTPGNVDPARAAVIVGSGVGGILTLEDQIATRVERGVRRVSPMLIPMMMANATAGLIALHHGFHGAAFSIATACASGTNSIGEAADRIRAGRADVVIAGGTEASITPTAMAAFARMAALSTRNDDPTRASRPFDADRDGFVMGEGAGILVLESAEHARARGARILGEIAGYGASCDAHHITAPHPAGTGAISCMEEALADAGLDPADIAHINAHGTSTPLNDAAEALAVEKVFGPNSPPITSTKGATGHLIGAAGAVEAILALQAASTGTVPPTANHQRSDLHATVDLVVGSARTIPIGPVITNSFGFGGHNASLVLTPAGEPAP